MPLYFAYGANMDAPAMAKRCPRSQVIGPARLMRHRLEIMREGWLTVVRDAKSTVHGVLWILAVGDVAALDRFEDTGGGLYVKIIQPVIAAAGSRRALVYVGSNEGPGRARADYLASVVAAARSVPLPAAGLAALERLAATSEAGVRPTKPTLRRTH